MVPPHDYSMKNVALLIHYSAKSVELLIHYSAKNVALLFHYSMKNYVLSLYYIIFAKTEAQDMLCKAKSDFCRIVYCATINNRCLRNQAERELQ